uniref:Uncharacterized protein n=1 Tax=Romanomermis culicivorax TaxID=13658 RepID=A0A915HS76_ROMCU
MEDRKHQDERVMGEPEKDTQQDDNAIASGLCMFLIEKQIFDNYWCMDHDMIDEGHKATASLWVTLTLNLMLYFLLVGEVSLWLKKLQILFKDLVVHAVES